MNSKILSVLAVLCFSAACHAATVEESVRDFSDGVGKYLHFKRETQVFVEPIVGPQHLGATTPDDIHKLLCDQLRKNDLTVTSNARLRISSKAQHVYDSSDQVIGIEIRGILVDPFDDVLLEFALQADPASHVAHQRQFVYKNPAPRKSEPSHDSSLVSYDESPAKKPTVSFQTPKKRTKRRVSPTIVISLDFKEPPKR